MKIANRTYIDHGAASLGCLSSQLFIPTATTFLCYLCIAYGANSDNINGLIAPLVFVFLLSYWISSMFLEIFAMGIETILCCYIADEEMFKVEDRFVEGELASMFASTTRAVQEAKNRGRVANEIVVKPAQVMPCIPLFSLPSMLRFCLCGFDWRGEGLYFLALC